MTTERAPQEPLALTMADAAKALSISRAQVYRLADAGQIRTIVVGQRRRVPRQVLDELLAGNQVAATR
jgi:excisionase family DNA binding protein